MTTTPLAPAAVDGQITENITPPAIDNTALPSMPEWKINSHHGLDIMERTFRFKNLRQSLDFANQVGLLAENEGYTPTLLVEWGKATVSWWVTHNGGIQARDFIMATRVEWVAGSVMQKNY